MTEPHTTTGHDILFAIHDWGLGHATRNLAVIQALLDGGHRVGILSYSRSLALLRSIFGDRCTFHEFADIPKPFDRNPAMFYLRMSLSMPRVFQVFRREHRHTRELVARHGYDRILSDSRFGVALEDVPSYYLLHSLRHIIPGRPALLERGVERSQQLLLRRARAVLVPDTERDGLAGELCHDLRCDWGSWVQYVGPLSDVRPLDVEQDIRCFISVSGEEPHHGMLERLTLEQAPRLAGRIVVALGRPDRPGVVHDDGRVTIHGFLDREAQARMMNRAGVVVTRSGYTTLMELSQLGRKALFIPTPGQSEQEHLARLHRERGATHGVRQRDLDLPRDVAIAESLPGLPRMQSSEVSVQRLMSIVLGAGVPGRGATQFAPEGDHDGAAERPDTGRP